MENKMNSKSGNEIFTGSAVALAVPMDKTGSVDFDRLKKMLDFQLENGTDAILVNGTTGESSVLSDEEKLQILRFAVSHVSGAVPVLAGAGSNNTEHSIYLTRESCKAGADGLLLVTPYYNKTSQQGLIRHFTAIADQSEKPVLLYNVPSRTGVNVKPETYQELAKHPMILGTKEAGGNLSHVAQTAALCGEDFHIYSGNDDQTLAIMALGGKGVISVLANIMPKEMHEMCQAFFMGDLKKSRQYQLELLDIMEAMFWDVNPIPVKAALASMGMYEEVLRLPLVPAESGVKTKIEAVMKKHGLIGT